MNEKQVSFINNQGSLRRLVAIPDLKKESCVKVLGEQDQIQADDMGTEEETSSERTCVGCREKASPEKLERFVYIEGAGLIFDVRKKAPGRGVYVHARPECVRQATTRGGFSRGLKRAVQGLEVATMLGDMREGIARRLRESLQSAVLAQSCEVGSQKVAEAVAAGRVHLLLVAADAGESTRMKYVSNADRKQIATENYFSGEELGSLSGREFIAVMAITQRVFSQRIKCDICKLRELVAFEG